MSRIVINFPYSGYEKGDLREELFWQITDTASSNGAELIVVVITEDTLTRDGGRHARAFLDDPRVMQYNLHVHRTFSVDTCQTWLAGWGVALGMLPCTGRDNDQALVLAEPHDDDRIILLPGDIDAVADRRDFFAARLPGFLDMDGVNDIVVGDFETGEKLAAKDLIDLYGTYPLFALWFPEIARATRDKSLWKPRSEFLNVRARVLRDLLLTQRKFAYEQTLNMLIRSWNSAATPALEKANAAASEQAPATGPWRYKIHACRLGVFADDPASRNIPGAIDQIERTERMLKMIWREFRFGEAMDKARAGAEALDPSRGASYREELRRIYNKESAQILKQYDSLEATSRAIEAAARVTVLSFISE